MNVQKINKHYLKNNKTIILITYEGHPFQVSLISSFYRNSNHGSLLVTIVSESD